MNILIIEDNLSDADLLKRELKKGGFDFTALVVESGPEFEKGLKEFNPDIILSDYSLPSFDAVSAFKIKEEVAPLLPFIIVSGTVGEDTAVELIKSGVTDYALKDKLFTLPTKIRRAIADCRIRDEKRIISEQLLLQAEELKHANAALKMQVEEKEQKTIELLSANKELLAFAYISSHDLQEPLRKIQVFADFMLADKLSSLSEKGARNLEKIQGAAERMQQLIKDLLTFSKTKAQERTFQVTDLKSIIDDVTHEFQDTIDINHATVDAKDHCFASVIVFQFRQLMHNLLSNALKFSQSGVPSQVVIKCKVEQGKDIVNTNASFLPDKEYNHISIRDNGIGFKPEFNEYIFEVFKRLNGNDAYEGTGIGLAIVKKIVENHNGVITATGVVNEGATFDIYLPIEENPHEQCAGMEYAIPS